MSLYQDYMKASRELYSLQKAVEALEQKAMDCTVSGMSLSQDGQQLKLSVSYGYDAATKKTDVLGFDKAADGKAHYLKSITYDSGKNQIVQTFEDADGNTEAKPVAVTLPYTIGKTGEDVTQSYKGHTWSTDYANSKDGERVYYAPDGKTKQWSASSKGNAGTKCKALTGSLTVMELGVTGLKTSVTILQQCVDLVWNALATFSIGGSIFVLNERLGADNKLSAAKWCLIPGAVLVYAFKDRNEAVENKTVVLFSNARAANNQG